MMSKETILPVKFLWFAYEKIPFISLASLVCLKCSVLYLLLKLTPILTSLLNKKEMMLKTSEEDEKLWIFSQHSTSSCHTSNWYFMKIFLIILLRSTNNDMNDMHEMEKLRIVTWNINTEKRVGEEIIEKLCKYFQSLFMKFFHELNSEKNSREFHSNVFVSLYSASREFVILFSTFKLTAFSTRLSISRNRELLDGETRKEKWRKRNSIASLLHAYHPNNFFFLPTFNRNRVKRFDPILTRSNPNIWIRKNPKYERN